eukprot:1282001-Pyramimonas_sp.AAC.1
MLGLTASPESPPDPVGDDGQGLPWPDGVSDDCQGQGAQPDGSQQIEANDEGAAGVIDAEKADQWK